MNNFSLSVTMLLTTQIAVAQEIAPPRQARSETADAVSPNVRPEPETWRTPALVAGAITFGVSYGLALVAATADAFGKKQCDGIGVVEIQDSPCELKHVGRPLFVPIAGPLIAMNPQTASAAKIVLISDSLFQLAGASLLVIGLIPSREAATSPKKAFTVYPTGGLGSVGLAGRF
jgi:hypothetical protein